MDSPRKQPRRWSQRPLTRTAGITDPSGPHLLRHTFATHALRARPNLRAVQEVLGHAWVTTTQRYTHLEVEDLQAQVADLPANG